MQVVCVDEVKNVRIFSVKKVGVLNETVCPVDCRLQIGRKFRFKILVACNDLRDYASDKERQRRENDYVGDYKRYAAAELFFLYLSENFSRKRAVKRIYKVGDNKAYNDGIKDRLYF